MEFQNPIPTSSAASIRLTGAASTRSNIISTISTAALATHPSWPSIPSAPAAATIID